MANTLEHGPVEPNGMNGSSPETHHHPYFEHNPFDFGIPQLDDDGPPSPASIHSTPMSIHLPSVPTPPETALAALQYLPVPLLVLGPLKTVVLANEAMYRLLCENPSIINGAKGPASERQNLHGQTLSQIGVDMMQGGTPVWVQWEVMHECDISIF